MDWIIKNDQSPTIISAKKHINSSHGLKVENDMRDTAIVFELGYAMPLIQEKYKVVEVIERLPCFLHREKCFHIEELENVSFVQGGYGAPAAVDVLETILELGAKRIVVVGFCGGFTAQLTIGDLIIPPIIKREEGTSYHYLPHSEICKPDTSMHTDIASFFSKRFNTHLGKTVSTDAVYRQTIQKEKEWLEDYNLEMLGKTVKKVREGGGK